MSTKISEQALLGHCLWNPQDIAELLGLATPAMMYEPTHASLASLLQAMQAEGLPIEPSTVVARLAKAGEPHKWQPNPGAVIHTYLQNATRNLDSARYHAEQVRRHYAARQLQVQSQRVADQLRDGSAEADSAVLALSTALDTAHGILGALDSPAPLTVGELLSVVLPTRWRVPGLIGWREKLIWTGSPGVGKTELAAMLAACAAAGLHPFTGELHEPVRVLVVDLENELDALRRRYRRIVGAIDLTGAELDRSRLMVESREQGMDITRPDDVAWLSRLIDAADPGILMIGPLYKLARGHDLNKEEVAVQITGALDELRVRHDLAVLIEAHPSKEKGSDGYPLATPRGSSVFLGWPSGGFGIRPAADDRDLAVPKNLELRLFRRFREDRQWPDGLMRHDGWEGCPVLPFLPVYAERWAGQ